MSTADDDRKASMWSKHRRMPGWVPLALLAVVALAWMVWPRQARVQHSHSKMMSVNNLKQIGLGMAGYYDAFDRLPPRAICDKGGKPLLSWRVAILPYMEQGTLYDQFKLDEPWDSTANKLLIAKMPRIYLNPKSQGDWANGLTNYKVFAGKKSVFDEPVLDVDRWQNRWSWADLEKSSRGPSNVILCVEAGEPIAWTKPEDLEYDPAGPLPAMTPVYVGRFVVLKGDGSVFTIRKNTPESLWRAGIEPNNPSKESLDQ